MTLHPGRTRSLPVSDPDAGQASAADLAEQFSWYPTVEAPGTPDFHEVLYGHYKGASQEMREMLTSILHPEADGAPPRPSPATPAPQPLPARLRRADGPHRRGTCCCHVRHNKKRSCGATMVPRHELLAERARSESEVGTIRAEKEHLAAQLSRLEALAREGKDAKEELKEAKKRVQALKTIIAHCEAEPAAAKRRPRGAGPSEDGCGEGEDDLLPGDLRTAAAKLRHPPWAEDGCRSPGASEGQDETGSKGTGRKRLKQPGQRTTPDAP